MGEREIIVSGHKGKLAEMLRQMADDVENTAEGMVQVQGNGAVPDLCLRFSVEIAPEFQVPCVDYAER